MAETSRQRTGELLKKLFEILKLHPEGMPAGKALEALANTVTLTPYESGHYESGVRRFEKIVRFATVACVKGGWLVKHKGIWAVTDVGISADAKFKDPAEFCRETGRLYAQWRASQSRDPVGLVNVSAKLSEQVALSFDADAEAASVTYDRPRSKRGARSNSISTRCHRTIFRISSRICCGRWVTTSAGYRRQARTAESI
ncbi:MULTISPECIES: hypothetical protein [unclassified Caballeronia]|uniref:hypothetical protein n=1 Tax=unclassified Caballeronia TaxID=2646786 RepID=UPI00285483AC|nr:MULTISPECIES: hypothetical protein [unclassified Caballeronia]MDR5739050.1 hypothetical protein [Caballeronia sp. LZ016]MDR5807538.1 hypothetical protein [Caballeronia sp. LZ019]